MCIIKKTALWLIILYRFWIFWFVSGYHWKFACDNWASKHPNGTLPHIVHDKYGKSYYYDGQEKSAGLDGFLSMKCPCNALLYVSAEWILYLGSLVVMPVVFFLCCYFCMKCCESCCKPTWFSLKLFFANDCGNFFRETCNITTYFVATRKCVPLMRIASCDYCMYIVTLSLCLQLHRNSFTFCAGISFVQVLIVFCSCFFSCGLEYFLASLQWVIVL